MGILGIKTAIHREIIGATKAARVWVDIYQAYDLLHDFSESELLQHLKDRGFRVPSRTLARISARAMARVR